MTQETKHTPGNWSVKDREYRSYIKSGGVIVAHCDEGSNKSLWPNTQERLANASLIAAAPELLAALEYMIEVCPAIDPQGEDAHERARAAIAKAKGGAA